jgi:predicted DCC family thiol-disulfide oxidoreductase YuxK
MLENDIESFEIEVFFDGGCPLCAREMNWLRSRDKGNRIKFTDIDDPTFDSAVYGKPIADLMAQMHGRLPNGTWLRGVEVFRRIYSAIGFQKLTFLSRLPIISQALTAGYWLFARYRRRLTGRCIDGECAAKRATAVLPKTR